MPAPEQFEVDPAELHLPSSRFGGADPMKLHRQLARHGTSLAGMPPLLVLRGTDGELVIYDGVTRAVRAAKYAPGSLVPVEVVGNIRRAVGKDPTIKDRI